MTFQRMLVWAAGGVTAIAAGVLGQPVVRLVDVPAGATSVDLYSLNADGTVASGSVAWPGVGWEWIRWTPDGGTQPLGQPAGVETGAALAVSGDGQTIVGYGWVGGVDLRAYRWTELEGFMEIPAPFGYSQPVPVVISYDGSVIAGKVTGAGFLPACRWTAGSTEVLPILGPTNFTDVFDMTPDGNTMVGESSGRVAWRWTAGGGMQDLGSSPQPGCFAVAATGVSSDGEVVVGSCSGLTWPGGTFPGWGPWTWRAGTGIVLQPLAAEIPGIVQGCSDDGTILFGSATVAGRGAFDSACLWLGPRPAVWLSDLLVSLGGDTTGWELTKIEQMSDDGSALLGRGKYLGADRVFVVTGLPPLCEVIFDAQPQPTLVLDGDSASMSVSVTSTFEASYLWLRGDTVLVDGATGWGSSISGSATATLTVAGCGPLDRGEYRCIVTNGCATAFSLPARLNVNAPCTSGVQEQPVGANCAGTGQDCVTVVPVFVDTCGSLVVEYTNSPAHCSSVGMKFFLDGVLVATRPPTGPGASTGVVDLGPVAPGGHELGLEAFGEVGGCNSGFLQAWGGRLRTTICIQPPTVLSGPVPVSGCTGSASEFSVTAAGGGPPSVFWEISDPATPGAWLTVANGLNRDAGAAPVFTATFPAPATLRLIPTAGMASAWPGGVAMVRAVVVNSCGEARSEAVPMLVHATCPCGPADIAQSDGTAGPDGAVNNGDFQCFFAAFFTAECAGCGVAPPTFQPPCNVADIAQSDATPGYDGCVNNGDFQLFFAEFFLGCP